MDKLSQHITKITSNIDNTNSYKDKQLKARTIVCNEMK